MVFPQFGKRIVMIGLQKGMLGSLREGPGMRQLPYSVKEM